MAHLTCSRHNRRVQVINIGDDTNRIPLVVHRTNTKNNDVCDSATVTIDGEFFKPFVLLSDDWQDDPLDIERITTEYLAKKHDALVFTSDDAAYAHSLARQDGYYSNA